MSLFFIAVTNYFNLPTEAYFFKPTAIVYFKNLISFPFVFKYNF